MARPKFSSSELTTPDGEEEEEEASIILCLAHLNGNMVWQRNETGSVKLTFRQGVLILNNALVQSNESDENMKASVV